MLALVGWAASAQERPFALTARQSIFYDSNVLRLPDGPLPATAGTTSRSDWISTTTLRADYANVFGSQDVSAFAEVNATRFRNLQSRDATGYALGGRWTGDLDRAWFIAADASSSRFLTSLFNQVGTERNLRTVNAVGATLGRRITNTWSLVGRADLTDVTNSASDLRFTDRRTVGYEFGVRYQPLTGLDGDLVARRVNGTSPQAQTVAGTGVVLPQAINPSFVQDQAVVRARYVVTGKSTFNGELGLTRLTFDSTGLNDFRGLLYGITYVYNVSDVLTLNAVARRDLTSTLLAFAAPVDQVTLSGGASWRLTGRTTAGATAEFRRLNFFAAPTSPVAGLGAETDRIRTFGVTLGYEVLRTVLLTGSLQRFQRTSSLPGVDSTATVAGLTLEWRFR